VRVCILAFLDRSKDAKCRKIERYARMSAPAGCGAH